MDAFLRHFLQHSKDERAYETIGGLFELVKDDMCEKNLAQRLWELFNELLQVVIDLLQKVAVWISVLLGILLNTYTSRNYLKHHF